MDSPTSRDLFPSPQSGSHRSVSLPVRLAYLGGGIYVRDAHIPSLLGLRDRFDVLAFYSRTQATASARCDQWQKETGIRPDHYTDPDLLLMRDDIDAIGVALPISLMPDFVLKALAAGKHVISEKPIAPDLETARNLYALSQNYPDQVWMVAENWRYESAYRMAAQMIHDGALGDINSCQFHLHLPITPESKYWNAPWRRDWDFEGGWLIDGGVHHIAVLRAALGEIAQVQAFTTLFNHELAPLDTLSATIRFESGAIGTYSATYATQSAWPAYFVATGEKGSLRVERGQIDVETNGGDGPNQRAIETPKLDGVAQELLAFADAIQYNRSHLNTPEEALRDLAVIQAMLESARSGQMVAPDYRLFPEQRREPRFRIS